MKLTEPARALLESLDQVRYIDRSQFTPIEDIAAGRLVQDAIVAARQARGEVRCGYKIGFTNRTIWDRYGVHHPIWAPVYQHTVQLLPDATATLNADDFCEPRLEPEIVVKLRAVPEVAEPGAIAAQLEWVAHGFEVVQSAFANWQFTGAEAFAASGLHGALLVGPRVTPGDLTANPADLPAVLTNVTVDLWREGSDSAIDTGVGANVLDGPLHAIAHLMRELAKIGRSLAPDDIITTGTITDAHPLVNGQQWQTRLGTTDGTSIALHDLSLRVQAKR